VASLVLYSKAKLCGPAAHQLATRGQATAAATAGNTGNTRRARLGLVSRHCTALQCGVAGLKTRAPYYANATLITPSAMSAKGPHGMLRPRGRPRRGASASRELLAVSRDRRAASRRAAVVTTAVHCTGCCLMKKKTQFSSESWRQILQRCTS
jgi:hypothetical protein